MLLLTGTVPGVDCMVSCGVMVASGVGCMLGCRGVAVGDGKTVYIAYIDKHMMDTHTHRYICTQSRCNLVLYPD